MKFEYGKAKISWVDLSQISGWTPWVSPPVRGLEVQYWGCELWFWYGYRMNLKKIKIQFWLEWWKVRVNVAERGSINQKGNKLRQIYSFIRHSLLHLLQVTQVTRVTFGRILQSWDTFGQPGDFISSLPWGHVRMNSKHEMLTTDFLKQHTSQGVEILSNP